MRDLLRRILGIGGTGDAPDVASRHLNLEFLPSAIYAIGDVHGCLKELRALERKIIDDAASVEGRKLLVMLGDDVDRGPESAGVLDHLLAPPPADFDRLCLMGNHEIMAANFLDNPNPRSDWLQFGGSETLQSYGLPLDIFGSRKQANIRQVIDACIPQDHIEFLRDRPWTLSAPGWLFVHAGLRPGVPLHRQSPNDLFWIRDEFFAAPALDGSCIVHGHTPGPEPVVTPARICVDTGAFATGRLTALKITPDAAPALLYSD